MQPSQGKVLETSQGRTVSKAVSHQLPCTAEVGVPLSGQEEIRMFSCCYFMTEARTETLPYLKSITSLKLLLSLTAEMNE